MFAIDDALTVNQNLEVFLRHLKSSDRPLADILSASLPDISNEVAIDQGKLLDDLYAATAPEPGPQASATFDDGSDVQ